MGKENFVIKESLVKEWEQIGPTYEKKAGIILKPHHQNTYFGRMFGSKDSKTRFFQVALTKKMHEVLRDKLQPESFYSNNTVPMDHLSASKILIVTAFYIKHQIGLKYWVRSSSNSDLDEVLDNVIGLVGKISLVKKKRRFLSNRITFYRILHPGGLERQAKSGHAKIYRVGVAAI